MQYVSSPVVPVIINTIASHETLINKSHSFRELFIFASEDIQFEMKVLVAFEEYFDITDITVIHTKLNCNL